jgi:hypothetical protein
MEQPTMSRRSEFEFLLGRLVPDYRLIAEFRRVHREAVAEVDAEQVRFSSFLSCWLILATSGLSVVTCM